MCKREGDRRKNMGKRLCVCVGGGGGRGRGDDRRGWQKKGGREKKRETKSEGMQGWQILQETCMSKVYEAVAVQDEQTPVHSRTG